MVCSLTEQHVSEVPLVSHCSDAISCLIHVAEVYNYTCAELNCNAPPWHTVRSHRSFVMMHIAHFQYTVCSHHCFHVVVMHITHFHITVMQLIMYTSPRVHCYELLMSHCSIECLTVQCIMLVSVTTEYVHAFYCSDAGKLGHKLRSNIFFSKFRTKSDLNIEVSR